MVECWHWHTQHYGAEMYWGGILGHSLQTGRVYEELATVAGELKRAAPALEGLQARSDVAVLVSAESRWAMEFVGPLQTVAGLLPGATIAATLSSAAASSGSLVTAGDRLPADRSRIPATTALRRRPAPRTAQDRANAEHRK